MVDEKLSLEVLVSTMNQVDHSLINKMKIQSDAIIINQCDRNDYEELQINSNRIRIFSFNERGVGLSRNNALMRATADICLFADDDEKFIEDYKNVVLTEFSKRPDADIILFNVTIKDSNGSKRDTVKSEGRVRIYNVLRYGSVNIACKKNVIYQNRISFSLLFGGGATYGSGEDTLFLVDSLKRGLKIFKSNHKIAEIEQGDSTWFDGYNEKFFRDKGALYASISKPMSYLLILQFAIRRYNLYKNQYSFFNALRKMIEGKIKYCRNLEG